MGSSRRAKALDVSGLDWTQLKAHIRPASSLQRGFALRPISPKPETPKALALALRLLAGSGSDRTMREKLKTAYARTG